MNKILSFAILVACFSMPAYAQRSMSGSSGISGNGSVSAGTSGGIGSSVSGPVSFSTLPAVPPARFSVVEVSGVNGEFTPTTWTQFQQALDLGRSQLNVESKPLGEIAAQYRRQEKPKAKVEIVQDAYGRAIIKPR